MSQNLEKNVKRWLKRKVSITVAVVTLFAINGSIGVAADITPFSGITADKTGAHGSDSIDSLKSNLKGLDDSVNVNLGYEKIALLETWSRVKDYKIIDMRVGDPQADVITKSGIRSAAEEKLKTLYGNNFAADATFIKDSEEAKAFSLKRHALAADLSNYLPKILDKAEEVIVRSNEHDGAIHENTDKIGEVKKAVEKHELDINAEVRRSTEKDKVHDAEITANKEKIAETDKAVEKNKDTIDAEAVKITANKEKIAETDKAVEKNKVTIEAEVGKIAANTEKIAETDKAVKKNKETVDAEVGRSTAKDTEHDAAILENTKGVGEVRKAVETHKVAIEGLEERKADKVKTEKDLADLGKKLADEEKDRTNNDNKLTENINAEIGRSTAKDAEHDAEILKNTKDVGEVKNSITIHRAMIGSLSTNKADKVTVEKNLADLGKKLTDEEKDRKSTDTKHDTAILENAKGVGEVKKAVKTHEVAIEGLEERKADKVKTEKDLADLGKKLTAEEKDRKSTDTKHDAEILKNTNKIGEMKNTADTHELAISGEVSRSTSKDKQHDAAIEKNRDTIAKNFTNQEEKIQANKRSIEHLDKKVNKGTSMLVAMSNVDFPNLGEGDIGIGAGVGSYSGEQAVAVGIAYAVNEDMKLQAKWSAVAGDPHYNAIGGGISYRFRTR